MSLSKESNKLKGENYTKCKTCIIFLGRPDLLKNNVSEKHIWSYVFKVVLLNSTKEWKHWMHKSGITMRNQPDIHILMPSLQPIWKPVPDGLGWVLSIL